MSPSTPTRRSVLAGGLAAAAARVLHPFGHGLTY
jgi:hypothetical protein